MKLNISVALAAAMLLGGCATISPEECKVADWQAIGYQNGQQGHTSSRVQNYVSDCAEAGVTVDKSAWNHGYQLGLKQYCSPENGYRVGVDGDTYNGVCPNAEFVKQYQLGRQVYLKEKRLKEIEQEINDIDFKLGALLSGEDEKRKELQRQRKELVKERSDLLSPAVQFKFEF